MSLSVVIPMLDEAAALPRLVQALARLDPAAVQVVAVDGGSLDESVAIARAAGWEVVEAPRGRGVQINAGVAAARGALVCVLHADTIPPADLARWVARTLEDPQVSLGGFVPLLRGERGIRWGTTAHNFLKTWYAPLLFRPHLFLRGGRLLFGDHAMFFRRADFLAVGGCDPELKVMEDADLCIRLNRRGRIRLVWRTVETSDRRIAQWGALRANWIYLKVGALWALGARRRLESLYPDVR